MSFKTIGELVELQRGTTYKSALLDQPGPFLLGLGSIGRNGGFREEKLKTYGGDSPEKLLVYPNDLYVSLKDVTQSGDLLGAIAKVPSSIPCGRLTQDTVKLIFKEDFNKDYFYWLLRTPQYREYCRAHSTGTTNLGLSREDFFKFNLPELTSERLKLTTLLNDIEDKINISQVIYNTLKNMSQALFKSWFVDFEPVKAKMSVLESGGSQADATFAAMTAISGKDADALVVFAREQPEQYAELKATAELFPSAMQDSELGEIPEGWHVSDLSEVASLNTESWSKKNAPEFVRYVDLANTKWGVINSIETYQFSDAPSRARRVLKPHDTIVGTVRPGNGSYSYIYKTGLTGSTGFAVLTPKARFFSEYIYLCVTSNESIERLAHLADGGAYPAVNADVVLSTQCVLPFERKIREAVLKVFSSRTGMFFSYRANGLSQNEMLSNIRDTLLPKLLSGEITLPETEQAVSEAENV